MSSPDPALKANVTIHNPSDDPDDLPFTVHFCGRRGFTVHRPTGQGGPTVMAYGDELELTAEIVELMTDNRGVCSLLDFLRNEGLQIAHYGEVLVRRGPWPDGQLRTLPGSLAHDAARDAARREAWKIENPEVRAAALAEVKTAYGTAQTSRTLAHYAGDRV